MILKTKKLQLSMHCSLNGGNELYKKCWLGNLRVHSHSQGQERWDFFLNNLIFPKLVPCSPVEAVLK